MTVTTESGLINEDVVVGEGAEGLGSVCHEMERSLGVP